LAFLGLAAVYAEQADFDRFEPLYQRMIAAQEAAAGPLDSGLASTLEEVAPLLRVMGRDDEANEAEIRARSIRLAHSALPAL